MRYLSLCSGIEAATVAWSPLGWQAEAFSEIEKFPSAVLAQHYPETPNYGDMTKFKEWPHANIDVLVGGTPCQSFSVAGLRKGLADPRGNLMLTYLAIAAKYQPQWLVWENVPGVLSSHGGRDFGTFLGGLAELGYGFAYRILDAQYAGLAQRRKRVFVVGCAGDWRAAAAVLFERHSLSGHPAPLRETKQDIAGAVTASAGRRRGAGVDPGGIVVDQPYAVANCLTARTAKGMNSTLDEGQTPIIVHGTQDPCTSDIAHALGRNSGQENAVVTAIRTANTSANGRGIAEEVAYTLDGANGQTVAFAQNQQSYIAQGVSLRTRGGEVCAELAGGISPALRASQGGSDKAHVLDSDTCVRRLTPRECERLQGFPDDYTQIAWRKKTPDNCPDGPRYKALGNSMAVPVMRWIGERIELVTELSNETLNHAPSH